MKRVRSRLTEVPGWICRASPAKYGIHSFPLVVFSMLQADCPKGALSLGRFRPLCTCPWTSLPRLLGMHWQTFEWRLLSRSSPGPHGNETCLTGLHSTDETTQTARLAQLRPQKKQNLRNFGREPRPRSEEHTADKAVPAARSSLLSPIFSKDILGSSQPRRATSVSFHQAGALQNRS